MSGYDPEETTPFTHRPYGKPDQPPQEPSAPQPAPPSDPSAPSWDTYQQPEPQPYPQAPGQAPYGQVPYGQVPHGQAPYGQPAYGQYGQSPYGMPASPHPEANSALIMGIVALAGTFVCGILCVVGPFAWAKGAKVRREIDADPQRWSGRGEATAGYVMGMITTILMILAIVVVVGAIMLFAATGTT